jgi:hypothetical protein
MIAHMRSAEIPTLGDLVALALAVPGEIHRVDALVKLAPSMGPDEVDAVLAAARALPDGSRSRLLIALAGRADPGQATGILDDALGLRSAWDRATCLAALVAHLAEPERARAVEAALQAVERLPHLYFVEGVFHDLCSFLSPAQVERAVAAGVAAADDDGERARFLAHTAHLRPVERRDEAVRAVQVVHDGNLRAVLLKGLAGSVDDERIAVAAYDIEDGCARARALAGIAPHLAEPRRREAVAAALTAVLDASPYDGLRDVALHELLPLLDREQVGALLAADAATIGTDAPTRLSMLAPHAAPHDLAAAVEARIAPRKLGEPLDGLALSWEDEFQFAKVIPFLPAERRTDAAVTALSLVERLSRDRGGDVLARVAPHLTSGQLDETLSGVLASGDAAWRGEALARLAPHLGSGRGRQALAGVDRLPDPEVRLATLTALVAHLEPQERERATRAALDAAEAVDSAYRKASTLLELAAALPVDERAAPITRAYAATLATLDGAERAILLKMFAPLVHQRTAQDAPAIGTVTSPPSGLPDAS